MSSTELRNGQTTADPRLGFLSQTDPRNQDHKVDKDAVEADSIDWPVDTILDQQQNGACVGFAMTHAMRAQGWTMDALNDEFAWGVYLEAQRIDPWRGGQYVGAKPQMSGTSLLAAARVLKQKNYITVYQWASTPAQVRDGLKQGPGVLGCIWRKSMDNVGDDLLVKVEGPKDGGHAVAITGFDGDAFTMTNSWGESWGDQGTATIASKDLKKLLREKAGRVVFPRAVAI